MRRIELLLRPRGRQMRGRESSNLAKLYFRYGAMGSSKTANALMVQYNYLERGQNALIFKPRLDTRDGEKAVVSRSGLRAACEYIEDIDNVNLSDCDCIIVDEAQFLTREQVRHLADIVDNRNIPVICYGLRADFMGNLFEGSRELMAIADTIEEIKTVCWCGRKATFNARIVDGRVAKSGAQIQLGGNESYVALCRKHWASGVLAPTEIRQIALDKRRHMPLLALADPDVASIEGYLNDCDMFVLFRDGRAVSEICLQARENGDLQIRNLATLPEHQNRGYAAQLVRHAMGVDRSRCRRMVADAPEVARGYFRRLGFIEEESGTMSRAL